MKTKNHLMKINKDENIVTKGEIAHDEQFLILQHFLHNVNAAEVGKGQHSLRQNILHLDNFESDFDIHWKIL